MRQFALVKFFFPPYPGTLNRGVGRGWAILSNLAGAPGCSFFLGVNSSGANYLKKKETKKVGLKELFQSRGVGPPGGIGAQSADSAESFLDEKGA